MKCRNKSTRSRRTQSAAPRAAIQARTPAAPLEFAEFQPDICCRRCCSGKTVTDLVTSRRARSPGQSPATRRPRGDRVASRGARPVTAMRDASIVPHQVRSRSSGHGSTGRAARSVSRGDGGRRRCHRYIQRGRPRPPTAKTTMRDPYGSDRRAWRCALARNWRNRRARLSRVQKNAPRCARIAQ